MRRLILICSTFFIVSSFLCSSSSAAPGKSEVIAAMKKNTDFMMDKVSVNGGFLDRYSADLSERWGELPAYKSMIWVQGSTPSVGNVLLGAYKATGDSYFLHRAERTANALIWGQHPSGGWHYFINFDPTTTIQWYKEIGIKGWGFEEHNHYYGNCTFDNNVTAGATKFLLELYMTTLDPKYKGPVLKALNFILESQYPNGGWPQRYPPAVDYFGKGYPDYTAYHTYNDNVIVGNIYLMLEAWEKLGIQEYKEAALQGMDFVVLSQTPPPQPGWGQQYNMEIKPAAARSYEPAAVSPVTTVSCIRQLMNFYKITGNRRYLRGIPAAIEWLENSYLPDEDKVRKTYTHAHFCELGTNKPLYAHREGTCWADGRYWVDYEPGNFPGHYGMQVSIDVASLKKEYQRVSALSPEQAAKEYENSKKKQESIPSVKANRVEQIIKSMDEQGAWLVELSIADYDGDTVRGPRRKITGISTSTYVNNIQTLTNYILNLKTKK